jgi:hypothetical protein
MNSITHIYNVLTSWVKTAFDLVFIVMVIQIMDTKTFFGIGLYQYIYAYAIFQLIMWLRSFFGSFSAIYTDVNDSSCITCTKEKTTDLILYTYDSGAGFTFQKINIAQLFDLNRLMWAISLYMFASTLQNNGNMNDTLYTCLILQLISLAISFGVNIVTTLGFCCSPLSFITTFAISMKNNLDNFGYIASILFLIACANYVESSTWNHQTYYLMYYPINAFVGSCIYVFIARNMR